MSEDDIVGNIQRAAYGSSLRMLTGPTEEQWQAFGEAAAVAIASLPGVLAAEFDPASHAVLVTPEGEAMGFPMVVTMDGPKVTP